MKVKAQSYGRYFFALFALLSLFLLTLGSVFAVADKEIAFKEVLISSGAGDAELYQPHGIAIDSLGNIYVSDYSANNVIKYDGNGNFIEVFLDNSVLSNPFDICMDSQDNLYVVNFGSASVKKFDKNGVPTGFVLGTPGIRNQTTDGAFYYPRGIGLDASGNIYVTDQQRKDVQIFDQTGNFIGKIQETGGLYGVEVDSNNNIYIAGENLVSKYSGDDLSNPIWRVNTTNITYTYGVELLPDGKLLVSSINFTDLTLYDSNDGTLLDSYDQYGSSEGSFSSPNYVCLTSDGEILVVDRSNRRVQLMSYAVPLVTVSYYGNGSNTGTVPHAHSDVEKGSSLEVSGNTGSLAKTGYTFAGWNTQSNGNGISYSVGESYVASDDTTLYAQWTANDYSVTYAGNGSTGGTAPTDSGTYNIGDTVTIKSAGSLVKTGYTFSGWNIAADGSGTSYGVASSMTVNASDITLYAQWTANDYSVTYAGNGSTGGTAPTDAGTYNIGDNVTIKSAGSLVKTGYTFSGWNTATDGSGTSYGVASSMTVNASDITLYAQWTANDYSVTYAGNGSTGGTAPTDASIYNIGDTVTIKSAGSLVKTGYTFSGWNTAADGNGTSYGVASSMTVNASDITLYAQWTANDYSVTYAGNGSTGGTAPTDASTYNIGDTVTIKSAGSLVKTGYTFSGWNTAADGNGTSYGVASSMTVNASDITLYAQWTANDYIVTYTGNGSTGGTAPTDAGTYNIGDTVTIKSAGSLVKTGYTFSGWNTAADGSGTSYAVADSETMGANNMTLYAQWTANDYSVTYAGNGSTGGTAPTDAGTYNIGDNVTIKSAGSLVKTGYTFSGWNTAADGSGTSYAVADSETMGANNMTFYAQWTANDYSVTYAGNGSTGGTAPTDAGTYNIGDTVTIKSAGSLVKTGYTFNGWNTAADGSGTSYGVASSMTVNASDITLYAQWTANDYSVTYAGNGSTGGTAPTDAGTYNIGDTVTIKSAGSLVKTGYTFNGWNTAADGSGTSYGVASSMTVNASDITLYAQWTANDYSVIYAGNGSTGGTAPTDAGTYNIGDTVTIKSAGSLVKTGYSFNGWNTAADGSGTSYAVADSETMGANNMTFYAQWTANDYSVTYAGNGSTGGTAPTDAGTYNIGDNVTIKSAGSLVKTGYTFSGWNTATDGSGTSYADGEVMTLGVSGVTLYAQWQMIIDVDLKGLSVLGYSLNENFDPNRTLYSVSNVTGSAIDIAPMLDPDQYSGVAVNGFTVTSNAAVTVDLVNGANTFDIIVTGQDQVTTKTYSLTVNKLSDTANLKKFKVEGYETTPNFDKNVTSYSLHVTSGSALTLYIESEEPNATIDLSGYTTSGSAINLPLDVGYNTFEFTVLAANKLDQKTYALTVEKDNDSTAPSSIEIIGQLLSPAYSGNVNAYQAGRTSSSVIGIRVTMDEYEKIEINGNAVASSDTCQVPLVLGSNTINIAVTAEDKISRAIYKIDIIRYKTNSRDSKKEKKDNKETSEVTEAIIQESSVATPLSPNKNVQVVVNGKVESAGIESITSVNGFTTSVVTIDREAIEDKIAKAVKDGNTENTVVVPISETNTDAVEARLTGDIVKTMEKDNFKLTVDTGNIQYVIPAEEVQISAVANRLGVLENSLKSIIVDVRIETSTAQESQILHDAAQNSYDVVYPPVSFEINATVEKENGEKETVEVNQFSDFVNRRVKLPDNIDHESITTGVLYNTDGTFSHIPTTIVEVDGVYYAELHSMTNSYYSMIYNPVEVKSVTGHKCESAVNNLVSRLIIDCEEDYDPQASVTRGEFIEYLVKALGLYKTGVAHERVFSDMTVEYADALSIARAYGIVSGYPDGTFCEDSKISKEEAIVMLSNVIGLLETDDASIHDNVAYERYGKISDWAKDAFVQVANRGILDMQTGSESLQSETFSKSEAAMAIEKLLQQADLINK